jgi:hypothetical protein
MTTGGTGITRWPQQQKHSSLEKVFDEAGTWDSSHKVGEMKSRIRRSVPAASKSAKAATAKMKGRLVIGSNLPMEVCVSPSASEEMGHSISFAPGLTFGPARTTRGVGGAHL